jgi:hypothetical protein
MCPSTVTWKEKNQQGLEMTKPRLEATKKLRLVCKNWYECLSWNVLFLKKVLSLEVFLHKIPGKLPLRLTSGISDELHQDESMLHVPMFFTPERLVECTPTLYPNHLIIEHGFQLPSQFNLQGVCKLMIMAEDEVFLSQYRVTEQLKKLLQSINSESLKILILDSTYITNEMLLFLSRFSKLEYLVLPDCMIENQNIYWWMFSSLKKLILTLRNFGSKHNNIVLHSDNRTDRRLTFDDRMSNFM